MHNFGLKRPSWLPEQWLAFLFGLSLLVFGVTFFLDKAPPEDLWCSADDKSAVVCLRNWASAGGNVLTGIVAFFALALAAGQFKAAQTQALASLLPALNARIERASSLQALSSQLVDELTRLRRLLSGASVESSEETGFGRVARTPSALTKAEKRLYDFKTHLNRFGSDSTNDNDLIDVSAEMADRFEKFVLRRKDLRAIFAASKESPVGPIDYMVWKETLEDHLPRAKRSLSRGIVSIGEGKTKLQQLIEDAKSLRSSMHVR